MNDNHWQRDPPPHEAYSRVTNPERFRPLHARGRALLDRRRPDACTVASLAATHD